MGKTILVDKSIEQGKRLLEILDDKELDTKAALWFYYPESEEWRLILALPMVDKNGTKASYGRIQSILSKESSLSDLSLRDISVASPNDKLITLLSKAIQYDGNEGIDFSGNTINGTYIEKAYIYRLATSK
jgi:hypothetical protein